MNLAQSNTDNDIFIFLVFSIFCFCLFIDTHMPGIQMCIFGIVFKGTFYLI